MQKQHDILKLARELIRIPTIPNSKVHLKQALNLVKSSLAEYTIEDFFANGQISSLVHNQAKGFRNFKFVLNIHLDIIPAKDNQYSPKIIGDKLYGAGAMDMKANAACCVLVFKEYAKNLDYPLALQVTTDEEIGGFDGTAYQLKNGLTAEFVISSEPTNLDIVNQAKGIMWLEVEFKGKSAHGAYPWKGDNALFQASDFITKLSGKIKNPVKKDWITTINFSKLNTVNKAFNKVPDHACLGMDIRFVPGDHDRILKVIKKLLPKGAKLNILTNEPAMDVDPENMHIKSLQRITKSITNKKCKLYAAQGSSDVRHFVKLGMPGVEFGPVGGGIGSDEEWVSISSLDDYYEIIKTFLLDATK